MPALFNFGLTRPPRENVYRMFTFAWDCGCRLAVQANGWQYAKRWCRTHRAENERRERARFAPRKPTPATDAEVQEFLEGIGAQREGDRELARDQRRRGAAQLPFIVLGLTIAFAALFGIAEMGHHLREFATVMTRFGAACAEVAR
jgi:hypothetical protein